MAFLITVWFYLQAYIVFQLCVTLLSPSCQSCQGSADLVIAAKHLHGNAVLFRQAPAGDHQHEAFKVVEVVSLHHVQPVIVAQGRVYAVEEGDWTLVFGHTRAAVHVHVVDFVTCGGRGEERQRLLLLLDLSHLKFLKICTHDTATGLVLFGFFNPLFVEIFPRNKILWDYNWKPSLNLTHTHTKSI